MKTIFITVLMATVTTLATAQNEQSNASLLKGNNKTVYVIDGKVESKEAFEKLKSDNIQNIVVLKGIEQAMIINTKSANDSIKILKIKTAKLTDPSGSVGYVDITCDENNNIVSMGKVVSDSTIKTVYVKKDTKSGKVNSLTVGKNGKNNPLIITRDSKGKVKVEKDMDKISPNTIKSISVYKSNDLEQFAKYGDTSNGVIMVELK